MEDHAARGGVMDLERIACQRADAQTMMFGAAAKRVYCACGCGVFWYRENLGKGRPREYMNDLHRVFARAARRRRDYAA
jgi:hypothetical protein